MVQLVIIESKHGTQETIESKHDVIGCNWIVTIESEQSVLGPLFKKWNAPLVHGLVSFRSQQLFYDVWRDTLELLVETKVDLFDKSEYKVD